jgi:hypothetical protein
VKRRVSALRDLLEVRVRRAVVERAEVVRYAMALLRSTFGPGDKVELGPFLYSSTADISGAIAAIVAAD